MHLSLSAVARTLGADAFIIQDWGLFFEVKRLMPQLETHVSTQANIHDKRGAAWCREAGADRVTLSRELSLEEIDDISSVDIDLEIFSHGAICFCYSGLCELSSFACAGRSANRGMCAQPCRLPYEVLDASGRVLRPRTRARPLPARQLHHRSATPAPPRRGLRPQARRPYESCGLRPFHLQCLSRATRRCSCRQNA